MSTPQASSVQCFICEKRAPVTCGGCYNIPKIDGDVPSPRYCGRKCQRLHWKEHAPICRALGDRQQLYRVCDLAQKLFYVYREATYGKEQYKIKAARHALIDPQQREKYPLSHTAKYNLDLYGVQTWERYVDPVVRWGGITDFPSHIFKSQDDLRAALAHDGCRHAATMFTELVAGLSPGLVTHQQVNAHHSKGERLHVRFRDVPPAVDEINNNPSWRLTHTMIKVTLRSGEAYAVDLAGAQFGHFDPVVPWELYDATRIRKIAEIEPAAKSREIFELADYSSQKIFKTRKQLPNQYTSIDIKHWIDCFSIIANFWMLEWQAETLISLESMWSCSPDEFKSHVDSLIDSIHVGFSHHKRPLKYSKTARGRELISNLPSKRVLSWSRKLLLLQDRCAGLPEPMW